MDARKKEFYSLQDLFVSEGKPESLEIEYTGRKFHVKRFVGVGDYIAFDGHGVVFYIDRYLAKRRLWKLANKALS